MAERDVIGIMGGLRVEIMVSSRQSGDTCCVFVETTPPGGGPPIHKHLREEEVFTVLEGQYDFHLDGRWMPMMVGVPMFSLRDTYHGFRNVGASAGRMMAMTIGGGIDDYFRAISTLRMPEDTAKLNEISARYGYVYQPA